MHPLGSAQFLVTFALSIIATTLVSRFIYLLLKTSRIRVERVAVANGLSFLLCWILFVIWCSTSTKIYWLAGHVAFAPQVGWFIFDILRYEEDEAEEVHGSGPERRR